MNFDFEDCETQFLDEKLTAAPVVLRPLSTPCRPWWAASLHGFPFADCSDSHQRLLSITVLTPFLLGAVESENSRVGALHAEGGGCVPGGAPWGQDVLGPWTVAAPCCLCWETVSHACSFLGPSRALRARGGGGGGSFSTDGATPLKTARVSFLSLFPLLRTSGLSASVPGELRWVTL